MIAILKEASPCLILLDEVVAYARNLDGTPFDGFMTFCQSLTEAAKAVPGVLVVGSLPESAAEVGDKRGREALLGLEKVFGRIQSPWTPAQGIETFEIIRRRLFQELGDEGVKAREQTVKVFMSFYRNNPGEFPADAREKAYETQLMAAYPVHPELFRMLQTDWASLEKFQRTRGVLKMMAQIVYRLWRDEKPTPMIMPGDVPLTDDKVRTNALVPVPNGYDAVVSKEIAGDLSKSAQIEARSPTIGKNRAVTRAATAVFMGTAPYGTTNQGLEMSRVRLACAYPGEQPSQFSDALGRLQDNAAYLYSQGEKYWFSPLPSLNQEAEDRAKALSEPEVDAAIIDLLRAEERHKGMGFLRVHCAPEDPLGIEDAYEAALVILPPSQFHQSRDMTSPAIKVAADIIEHKGPGQRKNRNRLAFLAVDQAALTDVKNVMRRKLAWASIAKDADGVLQLPKSQRLDAERKRDEQANAAENAVRRGWKHLILPQEARQTGPNAGRGFDLEPVALSSKSNDPAPLANLAWSKCTQDGLIVAELGEQVLEIDLAKVWQLTQPHVAVKQLRDWFGHYPYLSKLRDAQVLAKAINGTLPRSDAKYAIADRFDEAKGRYEGLKLGKLVDVDLNSDMVLVRRAAAEAQIVRETPEAVPQPGGNTAVGPGVTPQPGKPLAPSVPVAAARRLPRRFYAKIILDPTRPTPKVSQIAQSILSELDRARGTSITLTLDIDAASDAGFADDIEAIVRDNAKSLGITDFGFEGE
jgi:uncharacterized protein